MSKVTRRHRHLKKGHESLLLPLDENIVDGHPSLGQSIGSTPLPPRPALDAHGAGSLEEPTLPSEPSQPTQPPSDPSHPTQSPDELLHPPQTQSNPSQSTQATQSQADREPSVMAASSASGGSEGRLLVYLSDGILEPSGKVSELIREKCFEEEIQDGGFYWSLLADKTIEKYWEWFKRNVYWNNSESENNVKKAWNAKASTCYSVYISRAKKSYLEENKVNTGISSSNIKLFESYWNREDTKAESERNKRNRDSVFRATWTEGSRSTKKWVYEMGKKGLPTDPINVSRYLHTRKHDGIDFVNSRAKQVNDNCEEIRQKKSEDSSSSTTCNSKRTYLTAIGRGPDDHNRLFGLGNSGHIYYGNGAYSRKATRSFVGMEDVFSENAYLRKRVRQNEDDIERYKQAIDAALKAADIAAKYVDEVRKMFQQVLPFLQMQSINKMQGGAGPSYFPMSPTLPVRPSYFRMPPFGFASTLHNMQDLLNSQTRRPTENEEDENTDGSGS